MHLMHVLCCFLKTVCISVFLSVVFTHTYIFRFTYLTFAPYKTVTNVNDLWAHSSTSHSKEYEVSTVKDNSVQKDAGRCLGPHLFLNVSAVFN